MVDLRDVVIPRVLRGLRIVAVLACALTAAACGERSEPVGAPTELYPLTVTTQDRPLTIPAPAKRIVVLDGGAEAILEAIGAGDRVVGSSVKVADLPDLRPDLVVAPSDTDEKTLSQADAAGAPVYVTPDRSVTEIERAITQLGLDRRRASAARGDAFGTSSGAGNGVNRAASRRPADDGLRRSRRLHERVGQLADRRPDSRSARTQCRRRRSRRPASHRQAAARARPRGLRHRRRRGSDAEAAAQGTAYEEAAGGAERPRRDRRRAAADAGAEHRRRPGGARARAPSGCGSLISTPSRWTGSARCSSSRIP